MYNIFIYSDFEIPADEIIQFAKGSKPIISRFNDIMEYLGLDHLIITNWYHGSEWFTGWNRRETRVKDLISELNYQLSCYTEFGCVQAEMMDSDDPAERKAWKAETGKIKRGLEFLKKFPPNMPLTY